MADIKRIVANAVETNEEEEIKETVYWGNSCITRYWVWNEEHNCIAYGHIPSKVIDETTRKIIKK